MYPQGHFPGSAPPYGYDQQQHHASASGSLKRKASVSDLDEDKPPLFPSSISGGGGGSDDIPSMNRSNKRSKHNQQQHPVPSAPPHYLVLSNGSSSGANVGGGGGGGGGGGNGISQVPEVRVTIELPSLDKVDPFDAERLKKIDQEFAATPGLPTIQQKMLFIGPNSYRVSYYWVWDTDMWLFISNLMALKAKYDWVSEIGFNPSGNTCCLEANKEIGISSPCFCDTCRVSSEVYLMESGRIGHQSRAQWFNERGPDYVSNNFGPRFFIEVRKSTEVEKKQRIMDSKLELLTATLTNNAVTNNTQQQQSGNDTTHPYWSVTNSAT